VASQFAALALTTRLVRCSRVDVDRRWRSTATGERGYSPADDAMTAIAMSPAELLFSDAEGKPASLEDLIDDGLDGAYRDRIPALIGLLRDGAPRDRLYACMVLTAWGVAEGFTALIGWAEHTGSAPPSSPRELLRVQSGRTRVAREVALSLGRGTAAASRHLLEELASSPVEAVASDAAAALARRA
jgi:hypothetical protein